MYLPRTFNVFTKNVRGFQGKGWGFFGKVSALNDL